MISLHILALVCFLGMISPGPDFLLVTRNSLAYSRGKGLLTALGIICGCGIHASYCLLGLALIITKNIIIFSTIKYLGTMYLIYIGIKACLSKDNCNLNSDNFSTSKNEISNLEAFKQGFLCNLLDPKLAVFLLSLFTQFISINAGWREKSIVSGIFFLEAFIYWPLLVLVLQTPVIRKTYLKVGNTFNKACGVLLVGLGLKVALSRD